MTFCFGSSRVSRQMSVAEIKMRVALQKSISDRLTTPRGEHEVDTKLIRRSRREPSRFALRPFEFARGGKEGIFGSHTHGFRRGLTFSAAPPALKIGPSSAVFPAPETGHHPALEARQVTSTQPFRWRTQQPRRARWLESRWVRIP